MNRALVAVMAALVVLAGTAQQASAWGKWSFGVGMNTSIEWGGRNVKKTGYERQSYAPPPWMAHAAGGGFGMGGPGDFGGGMQAPAFGGSPPPVAPGYGFGSEAPPANSGLSYALPAASSLAPSRPEIQPVGYYGYGRDYNGYGYGNGYNGYDYNSYGYWYGN